jgi:uncharacterized protein (DUF1697 family)
VKRYLAFLRAINVGGRTVKMADLRRHFEQAGLREVETFIASGNVLFSSPEDDSSRLEQHIEQHLEQALGYRVDTFLRTPTEVRSVATLLPFGLESSAFYVAFLKAPPPPEFEPRLLALENEVDRLAVSGREVYWQCSVSSHLSSFSGAVLEKLLGAPATLRNRNTVVRLASRP